MSTGNVDRLRPSCLNRLAAVTSRCCEVFGLRGSRGLRTNRHFRVRLLPRQNRVYCYFGRLKSVGGGRSTDIQCPISKGLTSKMPAHKKSPVKDWAERGERDSNPRVLDLQSSALATWPPPHPDHAGQTAQRLWPVPAARIIGEVSADDPLR